MLLLLQVLGQAHPPASIFSLSPYHLLTTASKGMYTSGTAACTAAHTEPATAGWVVQHSGMGSVRAQLTGRAKHMGIQKQHSFRRQHAQRAKQGAAGHSRAQQGTARATCEAMMRADVVLPVPGGLQQGAPRPPQF